MHRQVLTSLQILLSKREWDVHRFSMPMHTMTLWITCTCSLTYNQCTFIHKHSKSWQKTYKNVIRQH